MIGIFQSKVLADCNGTQIHNNLVRKRKLNYLAKMVKWLSCFVSTCLCSHLNVRYGICFKQGDLWYSGNYKMWIHSEKRTWHDKNIQSNIQAISSCCSKHKKNTENKDPKVSNTKNKTIMLWRLQCALAKNLSLLKNKKQQINEHLGIRVPLNKIPLLGNILLYVYKNE